jgi:uncharacterized protein DUF6932
MGLPNLNAEGDLPTGVHRATIDEVILRFGSGSHERKRAASTLRRVWELTKKAGHFQRLIIFGSFVTAKLAPNDVDIILIMNDAFRVEACDQEAAAVFDHVRAQQELGASVFWIRPELLVRDTLETFIQSWQRKRDGKLRGIVEVIND